MGGIKVHLVALVDDLIECSDEMEDMIARARDNPLAIILGTFHSYKLILQ